MGNAFRPQPGPAIYPDNKTPFKNDILEVGIFVAFAMIAFSFLIIIPGIRGWERLWATIRVFVALWIGTVLLVTNFAYTWQTDTKCVRTQYKAYTPVHAPIEIQAEVGLHIGLRGINVTLIERPYAECTGSGPQSEIDEYLRERPFPGENINYNEAFRWADPWFQGRFGFGRFASRLNQEFREAQFTGDPYPILWIAEYFTLDGEQIRWFRKFRQAGWYAHIFLWLGFATYLLSMLLFIFVISTGAIFMLYTGLMMLSACASFGIIIINSPPLKVPFGNNEGAVTFLFPTFGWAWWLTLWTGIATVALAILIWVLNYFMPRRIATVFHHSVVEEDEFFQVDEEEEVGEKPSLDEYGVSTRGTRRGGTTRGRTQRRGLSKYRQTQRKPRSTVRSSTRGQRLNEDIQLSEVHASGEK